MSHLTIKYNEFSIWQTFDGCILKYTTSPRCQCNACINLSKNLIFSFPSGSLWMAQVGFPPSIYQSYFPSTYQSYFPSIFLPSFISHISHPFFSSFFLWHLILLLFSFPSYHFGFTMTPKIVLDASLRVKRMKASCCLET